MLRVFNALNETAGLRDSTDADADEVIVRVITEERDNNGEDEDDIDKTDEILRRADSDAVGVPVLRVDTDGLNDDFKLIVGRADIDGELVEETVKVEPRDESVETVAKVD